MVAKPMNIAIIPIMNSTRLRAEYVVGLWIWLFMSVDALADCQTERAASKKNTARIIWIRPFVGK